MASAQPPSRPLSPHLDIYRFHFSMALSILHRVASMAVLGMVVILIAWLWAAAYSPECFEGLSTLIATPIGQVLLLLASFVFYFKLASGLRHLIWDAGYAFERRQIDRTGRLAIAFAVIATAFTWAIVWEVI